MSDIQRDAEKMLRRQVRAIERDMHAASYALECVTQYPVLLADRAVEEAWQREAGALRDLDATEEAWRRDLDAWPTPVETQLPMPNLLGPIRMANGKVELLDGPVSEQTAGLIQARILKGDYGDTEWIERGVWEGSVLGHRFRFTADPGMPQEPISHRRPHSEPIEEVERRVRAAFAGAPATRIDAGAARWMDAVPDDDPDLDAERVAEHYRRGFAAQAGGVITTPPATKGRKGRKL